MTSRATRRAFGVYIAMTIAAGCVFRPDREGAIRCGDAGECPVAFVCRLGRCCPEGSSAPSCPTGVVDAGPMRSCMVSTECGGGRECRAGICCDLTAGAECPPGAVGSPCALGHECSRTPGTAVACVRNSDTDPEEEFPRGYCSGSCDPAAPDSCAPLGVCIRQSATAGSCFRLCTPSRDCRLDGPGYRCLVADISSTRIESICWPDCSVGAACISGRTCYPPGHVCLPTCSQPMDPRCPNGTQCSPADGVCLITCAPGCPTGYRCEMGVCRL